MGEIRIVGPGKTRGYPYPVCKKNEYVYGSLRRRSILMTIQYSESMLLVNRLGDLSLPRKSLRRLTVFVLLFYVHGKHLRTCRDGQFT